MVPEDIFLSSPFSNALLAIHLITLVYFGFAWCYKTGGVFSTIFGKHFKKEYPFKLSAPR